VEAGRNDIVIDEKRDFARFGRNRFRTKIRRQMIESVIALDGRDDGWVCLVGQHVLRTADFRAQQAHKADAAADFENAIGRRERFANENSFRFLVGAFKQTLSDTLANALAFGANDDAIESDLFNVERTPNPFANIS
jgi:hypothetical protein